MKLTDRRIRLHFNTSEQIECRKTHLQETIRQSKTAFYEAEGELPLSGAEFLYQQSRYIHKRWWILQGILLLILWALLELTADGFYVKKCMGIGAPMFAVLLLPELWKNRNTASIEIECTTYYSLRHVYAARIFLFSAADFLLLSFFFCAVILTGKMLPEEIMIHFFLPYTVTCCICFRTLYSRRAASEIFALLLCTLWCAVWIQIVLNERIYQSISSPAWFGMTITAALYLGYCIQRGQKNCIQVSYENEQEDNPLWNCKFLI